MSKRKLPAEPITEGCKTRCVMLPDAFDEIVREAGYGIRSRGIRELVRFYLEHKTEEEEQ